MIFALYYTASPLQHDIFISLELFMNVCTWWCLFGKSKQGKYPQIDKFFKIPLIAQI